MTIKTILFYSIKYISIVGLFPTIIADQRSLSLEKQRATLYCSEWSPDAKGIVTTYNKVHPKRSISSSVRYIEQINTALHLRQTALSLALHFLKSRTSVSLLLKV